MNILSQIKLFNAIPAGVIKDDAAFVSNVIDKQTVVPQGARGVLFVIALGATDIALASLIVKQSPTADSTTALSATGLLTVKDATTKPTADDDNNIALIYVPMSKWTLRYLQIQATAGNGSAGTYLSAIAIIDAPGASGPDATLLGAAYLDIA
ncbi:MAG: hypothetical protein IT445_03120 [Phycisphaeraceae bacterium]|nr:hypothetical protein [Phycisphaeraceae bacterium]